MKQSDPEPMPVLRLFCFCCNWRQVTELKSHTFSLLRENMDHSRESGTDALALVQSDFSSTSLSFSFMKLDDRAAKLVAVHLPVRFKLCPLCLRCRHLLIVCLIRSIQI
jgi:hypothetical protein